MVLGVAGTAIKSATYARRVKNSREIAGVSTVTFGSKNEATPNRTAKSGRDRRAEELLKHVSILELMQRVKLPLRDLTVARITGGNAQKRNKRKYTIASHNVYYVKNAAFLGACHAVL
jgi:hypothetical protein